MTTRRMILAGRDEGALREVVVAPRKEAVAGGAPAAAEISPMMTVLLVLLFQNSSNLASAYGLAVTATMLIDSILFLVVARGVWRWPVATVAASFSTRVCLLSS